MEVTEKQRLYAQLPARICAWYKENKRILPWREDRNPYKVWISEIMLQQTRVEAVKPYFARFLRELPDIEALADCPEEKLLKLWEGLGYYSRVRNMQKAARQLTEADTGRKNVTLPRDPKELQKLPGIGSYTAGAIASIAYGVPVPAVDGNVLRILARVTADGTDILKPSVKREAEQLLTEVLQDCVSPGDFNQGMMDLGAGVCVPNAQPLCDVCPLADICEAHRTGTETDYPVRRKAKERRVEERTILLIRDGERVVLTRRQDTGLLAGMYEFPNLPGKLNKKEVLHAVEEQELVPLRIQKLEPAKHLFSHVEWHMTGYEIRVAAFPEHKTAKVSEGKNGTAEGSEEGFGTVEKSGAVWFLAGTDRIETTYPIPSAFQAYAKYLQMHIGMQGRDKTKESMRGHIKPEEGMQEEKE